MSGLFVGSEYTVQVSVYRDGPGFARRSPTRYVPTHRGSIRNRARPPPPCAPERNGICRFVQDPGLRRAQRQPNRHSSLVDTFSPSGQRAPKTGVLPSGRSYSASVAGAVAPVRPDADEDLARQARLAAAAREGDRKALKELFGSYKDRVYRTALLLLSSRDAAEAVTEEVFVRFYQEAPEGEFGTWAYRAVVGICLRHMIEGDGDGTRERLSVHAPDRGAAIRRRIAVALADLAPQARVAFVLREGQAFSYERIATVMETGPDRIAEHLVAARSRLAGVLEEIEFEAWNGDR